MGSVSYPRLSYCIGVAASYADIVLFLWMRYEFLAMLTVWPEEVRGDLRAGLRAMARGDIKLSQRHLMRCVLFVLWLNFRVSDSDRNMIYLRGR